MGPVLETVGGLVVKTSEGLMDKAGVYTSADVSVSRLDVSNVGGCPVQHRNFDKFLPGPFMHIETQL